MTNLVNVTVIMEQFSEGVTVRGNIVKKIVNTD